MVFAIRGWKEIAGVKGIMEGMESFDDRVYVRVIALFAGKGFSK